MKNLGLSMIIVPVIWSSFDFRPCKKKLKYILEIKNLFENGPSLLHVLLGMLIAHVAVADCATFAT